MANTTNFDAPGVYSLETDLKYQVAPSVQVGAAIIGLFEKGPAFVPTAVSSGNINTIFGGFNKYMYAPYAASFYLQNAPSVTIIRVLGLGNPANGFTVDLGRAFDIGFGAININNSATATYESSLSALQTMCILRSRQSSGIDIVTDVSYTGNAELFNLTIGGEEIDGLSLDNTLSHYICNVLGTDPKSPHDGDSATGVYVDRVLNYRVNEYTGSYTGSAYGSLGNSASGDVLGLRYITGGYQTGTTPMICSQPFVNGLNTTVYNLFQLVALTDGEASNNTIKVVITDIKLWDSNFPKIAPTFTVQIRAFDDTDARPIIYESFGPCNLDPESDYYIESVIGNRYMGVTVDSSGETPLLVPMPENNYPNKSSFVRVSGLENGINFPFQCNPSGFLGPKSIQFPGNNTNSLENDMPLQLDNLDVNGYKNSNVIIGFDFEGVGAIGFEDRLAGTMTALDGASSSRGFLAIGATAQSTFWTPSLSAAYNASLTSQFTVVDTTVTGSSSIIQGAYSFKVPLAGGFDGIPPSIQYDVAINNGTLSGEFLSALGLLENADAFDINLLCAPGVHSGASQYNGNFNYEAITLCETRADCFYIMDIGQPLDPTATDITTQAQEASVDDAVQATLPYNSSYGATYYPWGRIFDPFINQLVWVPPSVFVLGQYSYNDMIAQPWFAVAGPNRGELYNVIEMRKKLSRDDRATLYDGNVNPIAFYVNQGTYIDGQKTLLKDTTAVNRISVRRLVIYIKKILAALCQLSRYEFNTPAGQQKLYDVINPILSRIKTNSGLTAYKLIIDSTNNTADVINQQQMRVTVWLQPTSVAETIVITYNVVPAGNNFSEAIING